MSMLFRIVTCGIGPACLDVRGSQHVVTVLETPMDLLGSRFLSDNMISFVRKNGGWHVLM